MWPHSKLHSKGAGGENISVEISLPPSWVVKWTILKVKLCAKCYLNKPIHTYIHTYLVRSAVRSAWAPSLTSSWRWTLTCSGRSRGRRTRRTGLKKNISFGFLWEIKCGTIWGKAGIKHVSKWERGVAFATCFMAPNMRGFFGGIKCQISAKYWKVPPPHPQLPKLSCIVFEDEFAPLRTKAYFWVRLLPRGKREGKRGGL